MIGQNFIRKPVSRLCRPKVSTAKELGLKEFRRTIATSLGTAFAFVIGTVWTQVVTSAFGMAGISVTAGTNLAFVSWLLFAITAILVTFISVVAIFVMSRWAGRDQKAV